LLAPFDVVALVPALLDVVALLLVLLGVLDDPQPAITGTPNTTRTAISKRWRVR
jgi:uncharacterized membrane protein